MDLCKLKVSSGILYCSSHGTFSSCFRVVGGGNLFLTLVSKADQSGSVMLKSGDCAGQERWWSSPSRSWTMTAQFQMCEWGHCCLGKLHHCSEIMPGSWDMSLGADKLNWVFWIGKKGVRLWKEGFMYGLKWQWDCNKSVVRIRLVKTENSSAYAMVNYKVCRIAVALYYP
jgi:hypothetical protein